MALSRLDETDLLLPLFVAAREEAPFTTFLERLRRRVGAAFVCLAIRLQRDRAPILLFAGPDIPSRMRALNLHELSLFDRIQYDRMRPRRVYSGDEFDDHDPMLKARRARDMRQLGLRDQRTVRLLGDDKTSAWLILASERACTAADTALLSNLAPFAAEAVRAFATRESLCIADALNAESLRRAGSGWMLFDAAARVLALAPATAECLTQAFSHPVAIGQRLRELGTRVDRDLAEAAAHFASEPDAAEQSLLLLAEPRIEAILRPFASRVATWTQAPAMIALCRQPRASSSKRAEHLARLHDLPRREAELAVLLAEGSSLAEAGAELGLTLETARNYSKRLFARMGLRGQPDLVRAVHESCAMLA